MFQPYVPLPPPPPPPDRMGVYMLLLCDRVVYVGRTANVDQRIASHRSRMERGAQRRFQRPFLFNDVRWLCLPERLLSNYEGALIRALNPRYNSTAGGDPELDREILFSLGIKPDPSRRFDKRVRKVRQLMARRTAAFTRQRRQRRQRIDAFIKAAS